MLRKIIAATAVSGLAVACMAEAMDTSELEAADQAANACFTSAGVYPVKADLAVQMAIEMGAWRPADIVKKHPWGYYYTIAPGYLKVVNENCGRPAPHIAITDAGLAACAANGSTCSNVKALLALTDPSINNIVDQNVFSPTQLCEELKASFARQRDLNLDLANTPQNLPPLNYKLTFRPDLPQEVAPCGVFHKFTATKPDGTPLPNGAVEGSVDNLLADLCYFGQPHPRQASCGNNPFINFSATDDIVKVDPDDDPNNGGGHPQGASCLVLGSEDTSGQVEGTCCDYPNPNVAGVMVPGWIVNKVAGNTNVQKCSVSAARPADVGTPKKWVNLACHYATTSGTVYKGKYKTMTINGVLQDYVLCDRTKVW